MIEEVQQIADDPDRTQKAIGALSADIAHHGCDSKHVRMPLGDFSAVTSNLRSRVLALDNQQPLTAADAPQEKQNEN